MRVLNLRGVAEEIWAEVEANDPEVKAMLEAFAGGVNAYVAAVDAGDAPKPVEWPLAGAIPPWEPVDSLTVARLQSWDLSFDGRTDKIENGARFAELLEKWGETPLAGMIEDLHPLAPLTEAVAVPGGEERRARRLDMAKAASNPFYRRLGTSYWKGVLKALAGASMHPLHAGELDIGSNNWTVAGANTVDGHAMVANDAHLSLRNPPVFFEVHMNTTRAGGDIDAAGASFPGIPAVILGRNAHAAWGATVYYADASDVYMETVTLGDNPTVEFKGEQVPIVKREEVFPFAIPADGCESWLNDFIKGTDYVLVEEDGKCKLTVYVWQVPHHGPIIPASLQELGEGVATALSWKWTGFEPSFEIRMIYEYLRMSSPDDFFGALENFKAGAMNWVYGDVDGHIAYAAYCRVPVRSHIEAGGDIEYLSFLPYPGTGCCEWEGDVPLDKMPQDVDPERGYIITANADGLGHILDGDPYNDETYQAYMQAPGLRGGRVNELVEQKLALGPLSLEDMQEIQADRKSPLGSRLNSHLVAAISAAQAALAGEDGFDPALAPFADDGRIIAAKAYLETWDFQAEAGALPEATEAQIKSSIATSIFNTWAVFVSRALLADKFEAPYDLQFHVRFLCNIIENPQQLLTYDPEIGDSVLWDNTTTEIVETRDVIMLQGLQDALDFLENPEVAGVEAVGGFGTSDMSEWLWGKLHTLTMPHAFGGQFNIPSAKDFPDGYPCHGDNFVVNAANPGLADTDYTFTSGPTIRNVYTLDPDGATAETVIPGGQDAQVLKPHFKDQFDLWIVNQTHTLYGTEEEVVQNNEGCYLLE